jgi:hypothetical protein
MPSADPSVTIRIGSHSEKEYVEKTLSYFDGVMVGANLLEASPAATASLLLKLHNKTRRPYYVDPMTYAFGAYVDPLTGRVRTDLDWIKSEQKVRGRKGVTRRNYKRSYLRLVDAFGAPFSSAIQRGRAVDRGDFPSEDDVRCACASVMRFQEERLRDVFREDPETAIFADNLPAPAAVFAPYFYIEESRAADWISLNLALLEGSLRQKGKIPIHAVVCAHQNILADEGLSRELIGHLKSSRPDGVWLWLSRFDEHSATVQDLSRLRTWVEELAPHMGVFNMHGSFFSLALSKIGMGGIAHGVGYGEQKDVVPVIGQSTPTVQYYVRALHGKYSVPQVIRSFSVLKVKTPEDFFAEICECAICRGVIGNDLRAFTQFGEIHYSRPTSKRAAQTPAAAKRCRFHFLLNRKAERDEIRSATLAEVAEELQKAARTWSRSAVGGSIEHLKRWAEALR